MALARQNSKQESATSKSGAHFSYRPDIDGLRALAILAVIVYHAFPRELKGGYVGVDIFFVISGFLISHIIFNGLAKGNFSFRNFYVRRINRIFPALIVVLAACFVLGPLALFQDELASLNKHIASGAGFIQNITLMREVGYFDAAAEAKPLLHLWSLAIEEQYYFIYPLVLWAGWKKRWTILYALAGILLVSFVCNASMVHSSPSSTFYLPHTRIWELLAGAVLAYLQFSGTTGLPNWLANIGSYLDRLIHSQPPHKRHFHVRNTTANLGLFLLLGSIISIDTGKAFPGWWACLPVSGTSLIILAGQNAWVNRKILSNRGMIYVGLISYPLYLWHWPLLFFAQIVDIGVTPSSARIYGIALSFILACLTYHLIELPLRSWQNQKTKTWILCGLMFLIGAAGFQGYLAHRDKGLQHQKELAGWIASAKDCSDVAGLPNIKHVCQISLPNQKPEAILIGDSHAGSLFHGLSKEYQARSKSLIMFHDGSCAPVSEYEYSRSRDTKRCNKMIEPALQYAESNTSAKTVLLTMLGGRMYLYGERDKSGKHENSMANHLAARLSATFERLTLTGKDIVFIHDWPDLQFNPELCSSANFGTYKYPLLRAKKFNNCSIKRSKFDASVKKFRKALAPVFHKYPHVKVIDAANYLCDQTSCWGKINGQNIYADRDHLNHKGSEFVAKNIMMELDPAP